MLVFDMGIVGAFTFVDVLRVAAMFARFRVPFLQIPDVCLHGVLLESLLTAFLRTKKRVVFFSRHTDFCSRLWHNLDLRPAFALVICCFPWPNRGIGAAFFVAREFERGLDVTGIAHGSIGA